MLHASREEPRAAAEALAGARGVRTTCVAADLARPNAADRIVRAAEEAFGRIDILVNKAGTIRRSAAIDCTDDDWDTVIQINLSSVFRLCRAAARGMLERRAGKIINVASLLSFTAASACPPTPRPRGGGAADESPRERGAAHGVNVNAIAPGYFKTDNTQALKDDARRYTDITARIPAGRWGDPDDLGGAVAFLAAPASDYVQGHVLTVDGGWMGR